MNLQRFITLFCVLALLPSLAPLAATAAENDEFRTVVQPFLQQHCVACHGPEKQKSGIRYDQIKGFQPDARNLWTMVHEKLAAGAMPPEDRKQPTAAERARILAWIVQEQRAHKPGATRRLNRREFSAALQDVTGLAVDYAYSLPEDGKVAGFDTGVTGLQDTADSVAQMMEIARRAVDGIRFLEPAPEGALSVDLRGAKDARKALDDWKNSGVRMKARGLNQPGTGLLLEPEWLGDRNGLTFSVPPPPNRHGVLRLKLVVSVMKGNFPGIPNPRLWVRVGGITLAQLEITASTDQPQELIFEVQADELVVGKDGIGITLENKVEVPYAVAGFENEEKGKPEEHIPGGTGLFRPLVDRKKLTKPEQQPFPFIALQRIEVNPNHVAAWPPAEWQSSLGEIADNAASARRLLALWLERAWRRPAKEAELQPFVALYQKFRGDGASFDNALRAAFRSVLLGAPFRYLAAPSDPDPATARHAVASRLSFMLTGAPPDAELRRLAADGKLTEPAMLDAQTERLLASPRSAAFVRPFVAQWLVMGQPITLAMDHIQKQDFRFGRHLKASMQEETLAYVGQLLADNRPAHELIRSDWMMMNDILAIHYGYPALEGGRLRQVTLRPDDPRGGGILGHAGIQSMLCWMGDNWVIYRGAWTLRHILDSPPPPPPLDVPELNPADAKNHGKSFRELLKQHQADDRCSVCHKTMDPLGFAFQNFDLSGRWRSVEYERYERKELDGKIAWLGVGKTRPVDAVGQLPRGEAFKSFAECKQLLADKYQPDLVLGLLKNLHLYATGREADVDALAEIRAIMKQQAPSGYRLRDLVKATVRSRAFLEP
ncbi:cytochrome c [Verrucomicrobiota bacterium]|nr:cytochrome c [Verrucomicrobiota bacterium]